jgi:DNA-binding PadR family transcriptional regulator
MSLPHALLTALIEHPCSGSELAARFDRSLGYFWHATHQQIYRELGRLEEAGWVQSQPVESTRGRKRAYRVLPAGRKELKRWVAEEGEPKPLRDEMMVRLRAEAAIGPSGLKTQLERHLQRHQEQLELYRRFEARDFAPRDGTREQQLQHLVLKAGILHESLWVEVAQEALRILALPASK